MDFIVKHLKECKRCIKSRFPVLSIGYIPEKDNIVDHAFNSCNFSFILNGSGKFEKNGKIWKIQAPCVITQLPGVLQIYGPKNKWEELFLIYPPNLVSKFIESGHIQKNKPVWQINDTNEIRNILRNLLEVLEDSTEGNFIADKVDLLCELLIVESIIKEGFTTTDKNEKIFIDIQNILKKNFINYYNFDELASDYKISQSLLRKIWAKNCNIPPAKYSMKLRMNEACRLLIETKLSIGAIAEKLNFQDPFYFSRKFRKEYKITASEYRNTYHIGFKS